jgi:hypothetical protein
VSERRPDTHSERLDAPNQQAVGLDPPWVEGTGGEPGESPEANAEQQADAEQRSAKETPKEKSDKAKEAKSGR